MENFLYSRWGRLAGRTHREFFLYMDIQATIEHNVRYILGQRLCGSGENRTNHKRFDMCGQRDGVGGLQNNIDIMALFKDIPVTVRGTYSFKKISPFDHKHILTFHKGTGMLYQDLEDGNEKCILEFGGWGTVDIIMGLIEYFNLRKNYTY